MLNLASRYRHVAAVAALSCLALLAAAVPAQARTEPITLSYNGTFTAPTVLSTQPLIVFTTDYLVGEGPPLGPFTAVYPHYGNFDTGTFSGLAVFTAASDDRLVVRLGGSGNPTSPTTYAVTFEGSILGGTGRFERASGALSGPGTVDLANLTVSATLTGTIDIR